MCTYFTLNIAFHFLDFGFTECSLILGTHVCANWQKRRVVPLLAKQLELQLCIKDSDCVQTHQSTLTMLLGLLMYTWDSKICKQISYSYIH